MPVTKTANTFAHATPVKRRLLAISEECFVSCARRKNQTIAAKDLLGVSMNDSTCKECGTDVPMYGYSHTTGVLREDWKCDCGEEWSICNGVDTRAGLMISISDKELSALKTKIKDLESLLSTSQGWIRHVPDTTEFP